mmetsp:Transcript_77/g.128  ORF Transcript_77/g.128 Transcript_77/m.128 type:complete len:312 (+) Transcript_77:272-1207(+)
MYSPRCVCLGFCAWHCVEALRRLAQPSSRTACPSTIASAAASSSLLTFTSASSAAVQYCRLHAAATQPITATATTSATIGANPLLLDSICGRRLLVPIVPSARLCEPRRFVRRLLGGEDGPLASGRQPSGHHAYPHRGGLRASEHRGASQPLARRPLQRDPCARGRGALHLSRVDLQLHVRRTGGYRLAAASVGAVARPSPTDARRPHFVAHARRRRTRRDGHRARPHRAPVQLALLPPRRHGAGAPSEWRGRDVPPLSDEERREGGGRRSHAAPRAAAVDLPCGAAKGAGRGRRGGRGGRGVLAVPRVVQ